ncbi:MAG: toxin-antitoxin system protein [Solirubrobacteraceae bacterium]|jgi:hypothetical protein
MPETVIIRARRETRDLLRDLAEVDGATAIDTLERVIREASEARLLKALTADLSSAPERDEAELAEWDVTLEDGLDPDEDFSSWR